MSSSEAHGAAVAAAAAPAPATAARLYIMPDGPGGRPYRPAAADRLGPNTARQRARTSGARGKDAAWASLQARLRGCSGGGGGAADDDDAARRALSAIAAAGWRRRARWLNELALRDGHAKRFGALTAADMAAQFNPPPFGGTREPSAFEAAAEMPLWDNFRSITMDRQAAVLSRWEEHNRATGAAAAAAAAGAAAAGAAAAAGLEPAEDALRRWARVGRAARGALKRADAHSVAELEAPLLGLLERCCAGAGGGTDDDTDAAAPLSLEVPDGFGRLLLHGLCEFHGLRSATRAEGGRAVVVVSLPRPARGGGSGGGGSGSGSGGKANASPATAAAAAATETDASSSSSTAAAAAAAVATQPAANPLVDPSLINGAPPPAITCADVLLALREASATAGTFGAAALSRYVRAMHVGSDALSDDF